MFGSELTARHRSSWLPEGEAPPPYHGAVGLHRGYPFEPVHIQQSYPDLPTYGYRFVGRITANHFFCNFVLIVSNTSLMKERVFGNKCMNHEFENVGEFFDTLENMRILRSSSGNMVLAQLTLKNTDV